MTGIEQVAQEAGVSIATVSRALRGLPNVAPATRERVQEAARRVGYVANPDASNLARGQASAIGLVVPSLSSWFFGAVAHGAEQVLRGAGREVLLYGVSPGDEATAFMRRDLARRHAGLLVVDLPLTPAHRASARSQDLPMVGVGRASGLSHVVGIDNRRAMASVLAHLLSLGHRRIALVGGEPGWPGTYEVQVNRRLGYEDELLRARQEVDPSLIVPADFTADGAARAVRDLLEGPRRPTAVAAMSDEMAIGVLGVARELGLDVPGDLSVTGFDDHPLAVHLGLTTVRQRPGAQGRLAARLLLGVIEEDEIDRPGGRSVEADLVVRATTGVVPTIGQGED